MIFDQHDLNDNNAYVSHDYKKESMDQDITKELLTHFFKDQKINYSDFKKYQEIYTITHHSLHQYFDLATMYDFKYIVFHTVYQRNSCFNNFLNPLIDFFKSFKCKYKIIILGERHSVENIDEPVTTIYNELLLLKNNNEVIDLTYDQISNVSLDKLKCDVRIIHNAETNIGFGFGYHFVLTTAITERYHWIVGDINHKYVNQINVANHVHVMYKEVSELTHSILRNYGRNLAYLFFHPALFNGEVRLLKKIYHIYHPKQYENRHELKAQIDADPDIIKDEELDKINFFHANIDTNVIKKINSMFDVIFISIIDMNLLNTLINQFTGKLFVRVFGREDRYNYSSIFDNSFVISNKCYLLCAYEQMILIEDKHIRDKCLYLPLPITQKIISHTDAWKGTEDKIMFVCSLINSSDYYKHKYIEFKENFKHFEYNIFGNQNIPVVDENVITGLNDQAYFSYITKYKVMVYTSREERHLHYHPIEAIYIGMPVLYFKNTLLSDLVGDNQFSACSDFDEMREKVKLIFSNNNEFIDNIIKTNKKCLSHFDDDNYINKFKKIKYTYID